MRPDVPMAVRARVTTDQAARFRVADGVTSPFLSASMNDEPLGPSQIVPSSPLEAYAADVVRSKRSGPFGISDDCWLALAHTLNRLADLSADELRCAAPVMSDAIAASALAAGQPSQAPAMQWARALRELDGEIDLSEEKAALTEFVAATQAVVEEEELAGAYGLAYATLNGLLQAFGHRMSRRSRGNVHAQLGRAARQLGARELARDCYEEALRLGNDAGASDVVARALLGRGTLALTRGNYPTAREQFDRALANAEDAAHPDLIRSSHHGLMNCSIAAGDLDSALVHGWNVLRLCIAPESRAEALMNMAEICRLTGEHDAAIRAYAIAMEWTSHRGVRLHALSGAMHSAIAANRLVDARRYLAELDELLPQITDVYTLATVGVEIAGSLHRLGETERAHAQLTSARALATAHAFHEVVLEAEGVASLLENAQSPVDTSQQNVNRRRTGRSDGFKTALGALKGLAASAL